MGTVAEKLTYLNDTRLKIKDGLNKFGADLTENDTFRSYSNVLNDIYDKLPKVSGNGSNFTLKNAQNGKLDLFEMEGNTEQTTYTGKNLNVYPYNGYTVSNGMTFSANTDGTVLINGQNNNNGNSAFYFFRNAEFIIPAGTTYYIIPPSNTSIMYTMYDGSHYYEFTSNNNYSITFNEQTTITLFYVQIRKGNTTVFTNEKVYPMLSTIPVTTNDYEPYVGGTASPNPDFPQDIKVVTGEQTINIVGKNLFDNVTTKQLILSDGTINNNNSWNLGDYVKVQPNTQYTFSRFDGTGQSLIIGEYDKNKNFIQRDVQGSMTADTPYIITTTATTNYLRLNYDNTKGNTKLQLETGSTATSYEPYHNQDYEIDLHGKNLFDGELELGGLDYNTGQNIVNNNTCRSKNYIKLGSNATKFILILKEAYETGKTMDFRFYDKDYNYIGRESANNVTKTREVTVNNSLDTSKQVEYLRFVISTSNDITKKIAIRTDNGTTYESYYDYKLCKIGDYKDVIFKNNQLSSYYDSTLDEDNWYIKKAIAKHIFDTNDRIKLGSSSSDGYARVGWGSRSEIAQADFTKKMVICNKFLGKPQNDNATTLTGQHWVCSLSNTDEYKIMFRSGDENLTKDQFAEFIKTNNIIAYYPLATPTYEKITDETLISQLEAIETETGTNIFEVSNDNDVLPSLNVKRLKELEKLS